MLRARVAPDVKRLQTAGYFLCFALVGVLSTALGPSLFKFAAASGTPLGGLGLLFTVDSFGSVCGSLLAGQLLTRFAPHRQAVGAMASIAMLVVVIPSLSSLSVLLPAWWLLGLSKTFLIVTVNTSLIWVHRDRVGPYMNVADFFLGVGSLAMPIAIAQSIVWTGDLHWAYWAVSALTVLLMVLLAKVPSPQMTSETRTEGRTRHRWLVAFVAGLLFCYVGAEISFAGWIPSYVLDRGVTGSVASAAYYASLFWIAVTVGRLLWLPFTKRVSPERMLAVSVVACFASIGLIWLNPGLLVAGTIGFGLSMSSIFPAAFTLLARRTEVTGRVSAVCLCAASVGAMFFPWWIGQFLLFKEG